jgi:predicted N-acetyltransferase YhbS
LLDDYKRAVSEPQTFVAINRMDGVGVLVLVRLQEAMLLENVAVHPSAQERGLGCKLMALAEQESQKQGY